MQQPAGRSEVLSKGVDRLPDGGWGWGVGRDHLGRARRAPGERGGTRRARRDARGAGARPGSSRTAVRDDGVATPRPPSPPARGARIAAIHMTSFGLRHGPPEVMAALARGEIVDPSTYYFRTTPRFCDGQPGLAASQAAMFST